MQVLHNIVRAVMVLSALTVRAQSHSHSHGHPATTSALALRQIREVETGATALGTPENARARGFESVFGWIPMMGTHWFSNDRMSKGSNVRLSEPSQLMFSPVNGKETLVGAAFAYITPLSDSTRPALFDGTDANTRLHAPTEVVSEPEPGGVRGYAFSVSHEDVSHRSIARHLAAPAVLSQRRGRDVVSRR